MARTQISLFARWWLAPVVPHRALAKADSPAAALLWALLWSFAVGLAFLFIGFEGHAKEPLLSAAYAGLMHVQAIMARTLLTALLLWGSIRLIGKKNAGFLASWALAALTMLPLLTQWLAPMNSDSRWMWFSASELWYLIALMFAIRGFAGLRLPAAILIAGLQFGLVVLVFERIWGRGFFY
jgi:hypothetical protein